MALHLPPLGGSGGGAHNQPSLPSLPAHLQSDTHLTAHLASRFHVSLPISRLSSQALISINTYTTSASKGDGTRDASAMGGAEDMADRAFIRLGHRSENQAILFLYASLGVLQVLFAPLIADTRKQRRVWLGQDDSSKSLGDLHSKQNINAPFWQGFSSCLCLRHTHYHEDSHNTYSVQSRSVLRVAI
jgi:hypothetical protein